MAYGTILVVEDNPDILELVAYNLEAQGYTVVRAMTGENGLAQATRGTPDLVILDVMLPGINGLDVCRKLKQQESTRTIPIILLTAKSEDIDINCGEIVDDGMSIAEKGAQIFELIVKVASGERTKSEIHGYGQSEFVPWQIGAVM